MAREIMDREDKIEAKRQEIKGLLLKIKKLNLKLQIPRLHL